VEVVHAAMSRALTEICEIVEAVDAAIVQDDRFGIKWIVLCGGSAVAA